MTTISLTRKGAVPGAGVLDPADPSRLAFESDSWRHLNRHVARVEALPEGFGTGSPATGRAVDGMRAVARDLGSPRQLRQAGLERPAGLGAGQPPAVLYAAVVWLSQRLQSSSASVISTFRALTELAESGEDRRVALQELADQARAFLRPIGPIADSARKIRAAAPDAQAALTLATEADAGALRETREAIGAYQARIEGVRGQLERPGSSLSQARRRELEEELGSLREGLAGEAAKAERLRAAIGALELILEDGAWLESGLDELASYVGDLTGVWDDFASAATRLASEASEPQLEDPAWLKQALGLDDAVRQWTAINRAAKRFVVESLVDFPPDSPSRRGDS